MGSQAERDHGKAAAGGPNEVVDCGAGRDRLASRPHKVVAGRPRSPTFEHK